MTEYAFDTVPVPERKASPGRPPLPNPFTSQVATLVDVDGDPLDRASSFTVPHEADSTEVNAIRRLLANAGAANGVSVIKRIEAVDGGGSRITFWAKPRIVPPARKPREDGAAVGSNGNGATPVEDDSAPAAVPAPPAVTQLAP